LPEWRDAKVLGGNRAGVILSNIVRLEHVIYPLQPWSGTKEPMSSFDAVPEFSVRSNDPFVLASTATDPPVNQRERLVEVLGEATASRSRLIVRPFAALSMPRTATLRDEHSTTYPAAASEAPWRKVIRSPLIGAGSSWVAW
jgi:hypothetical protein